MKTIITLFIFLSAAIGAYGQAGIKIFTKIDDAKFKIVFDGEPENTIPTKQVSFDTLDYKKPHQLVITFNADTVADIEEEYYLLKNQVREFEILKKSDISKKSAKVGRKIGKVLRIGDHSKEKTLYDVYYLEERTKSDYLNN